MDETVSIVLFSGTDDKLQSASVLVGGAAALGKPVKILLQYWALEAFKKDRIGKAGPVSAEASDAGRAAYLAAVSAGQVSWADTLRAARELGEVDIQACSQSMEVLKLDKSDLDPMVDGVAGVAAFLIGAGEGQIVFI
jgi:peroxiredoxin family protein